MRAPRLERYEIVEELGRGGMSVVFRARDRQLNREVAVKVLHHFLADDEDARRRFRREALAVARLRHRSILEIYDSSEPGAEDAFLVTELIDGQTLRAWLEAHGPPPLPEMSALVLLGLAQALHHAHEQGILHRDLKPENVMVTKAGGLKLMDFGIAQILGGATRLTTTGTLLGSPAHMAPEVIDGGQPDHRSDLFSLGTILYWLVSGRLPFEAPNPSALFRQILEGHFDPPQMHVSSMGNGLARVIERALEPRVAARYQDVSEMVADLRTEVEAVGWPPTDATLAETLRNPRAFAERQTGPVVDRLLDEGRRAVEEGDLARAVDRLQRVHAHRPEDAEAGRLLALASSRPSDRRRPLAAAFLGVSISLLVGVSWWVLDLSSSPRLPIGAAVAPPSEQPAMLRQLSARSDQPTAFVQTRRVDKKPPPRTEGIRISTRKDRKDAPRPRLLTASPRPSRSLSATASSSSAATSDSGVGLESPLSAATRVPAILRVRIGRSFATIRLDGETRLENRYRGELELSPGIHSVEVIKPGVGRFQPRRIEARRNGQLLELMPGGTRRLLVGGVIDFRVPLSPEEAASTPGWVPG